MKKDIVNFSRQLRRNQTDVEKLLWKHLRSRQLMGLKFRRQQPIGNYIVDFVCFENKLIIELDGSQHIDDKDKDNERDGWLNSQGFTVIRYWNNDVMNNIDGVLEHLVEVCATHPPLTHVLRMRLVPTCDRTSQNASASHQGRGTKETG